MAWITRIYSPGRSCGLWRGAVAYSFMIQEFSAENIGKTTRAADRGDFPDKWAAIVWMCRNQLGRRNITDEQKTVLIGEAYKAQKMSVGNHSPKERDEIGKFAVCHQNDDIRNSGRTKDGIAKSFGVGSATVERAEHYVDGLNAAEAVSPGIREAVLSGAVKAPKQMIAEIRNKNRNRHIKLQHGRGYNRGTWPKHRTSPLYRPLTPPKSRPFLTLQNTL